MNEFTNEAEAFDALIDAETRDEIAQALEGLAEFGGVTTADLHDAYEETDLDLLDRVAGLVAAGKFTEAADLLLTDTDDWA